MIVGRETRAARLSSTPFFSRGCFLASLPSPLRLFFASLPFVDFFLKILLDSELMASSLLLMNQIFSSPDAIAPGSPLPGRRLKSIRHAGGACVRLEFYFLDIFKFFINC